VRFKMKINMQDQALASAMVARLTRELGDTFAANCALDLIGDHLVAENEKLREHNAALVERTTNDRVLIEELRAQNESLRAQLGAKAPKGRKAGEA